MEQTSTQQMIERDRNRIRREVLTRRVLDSLRHTIQLRAMNPEHAAIADDMRADFTDLSACVIAPLVEALDILDNIIFASDGCVGHRNCVHSMEPWQRARALLAGKWAAETDCRNWPSIDCPRCLMGVVENPSEAPYCPSCYRERSAK